MSSTTSCYTGARDERGQLFGLLPGTKPRGEEVDLTHAKCLPGMPRPTATASTGSASASASSDSESWDFARRKTCPRSMVAGTRSWRSSKKP